MKLQVKPKIDAKDIMVDAGGVMIPLITGGKISPILLTATNISRGTLNGSLVDIINLTANNIESGTLNAGIVTITGLDADDVAEVLTKKWAGETGATVGANWNTNLSNIPSFGDLAYEDLVESALVGTTIIIGGYIRTNLLTADNILTGTLAVGQVPIAGSITNQGDLAVKDLVGSADVNTTIISGGKIVTGLLTATNVQTGTLTGRTVQTASSGKRAVMDNSDNTLKFYSSLTGNPLVVTIDDGISGNVPGIRAEHSTYGGMFIAKKNDTNYAYINHQSLVISIDGTAPTLAPVYVLDAASTGFNAVEVWNNITNLSFSVHTNGNMALDGDITMATSKTVDGIDISAHDANVTTFHGHNTNAHTMTIDGRDVSVDGTKLDGIASGATVGATWSVNITNQPSTFTPANHNLIDTTGHPVSGLTTGHFLKATGATTYAFGAHGLSASDVGAVATATFNNHKVRHQLAGDDVLSLSADQITGGTLVILRGGTGASTFTASQLIRMNSGGTALESMGVNVDTGGYVRSVGAFQAYIASTNRTGITGTFNTNNSDLTIYVAGGIIYQIGA